MQSSVFQLNQDKTEIILFNNKIEKIKVVAQLESGGIRTKTQVRKLGVLVDPGLSSSNHIKDMIKSALYHLKQISGVRDLMSRADLEKFIHALISSRLDYLNVLVSGPPKIMIKHLQLIHNAATRVLTRVKTEHITAVLRSLHWFPVIPT